MKGTKRKGEKLVAAGWDWMGKGKWDYIKAAACFHKAAKMGSADGAHGLGVLYETKLDGFVYDTALAAKFFKQAADKGHTEAQMHLATLYADGNGVEKDRKKAGKYWSKAARAGESHAQFMYAMFLFFDADEEERKKNVKAAKRWLKAAQENGELSTSIAMRDIEQWEKTGYFNEDKDAEAIMERLGKMLRGEFDDDYDDCDEDDDILEDE